MIGFDIPFQVAPAPDDSFAYAVSVTSIGSEGDAAGTIGPFGDLTPWNGSEESSGFYAGFRYQIPAGATDTIPVVFGGNEVGIFSANYEFTFNDGTVVDAMLTANITEAGPPFHISDHSGGGFGDVFIPPTPVDCSGIERRPLPENGILVAEEGCVELISVPVEVGNGLMATRLVARGVDPDATLVTVTNVSISNVHQVWAGGGIQSAGGTAVGKPGAGPTYHEDWIPLDSHSLISKSMIGGGIGEITETNAGESPVGDSLPEVLNFKPITGHGAISMSTESDAFFLLPDSQSNMLDIAYIVSDGAEPVELTLGLLGSGIRDAGTANGATFGYGVGIARLSIPLSAGQAVPEPRGHGLVLLAGMLSCVMRRYLCGAHATRRVSSERRL